MIALIPRRVLIRAMAAGLAGAALSARTGNAATLMSAGGKAPGTNAHSFSLPGADGRVIDLAAFAGRPVLVVNTASHCAYTP